MSDIHRFHFLRPSTRAFIEEARRTPDYGFWDWVHGYVYARWPYLYIGVGTGEHWLARTFRPLLGVLERLITSKRPSDDSAERVTFADTYHGKVVPLEEAKRLVTVEQEVTLSVPEKVIPYALARDIVLRNPDHIVALECPCRSVREGPCTPLDVCLIVGEPFAGFVIEHHPRRSRWISQQEAVQILVEERDRGHVHHAFLKDAMLGRFYAICNCCSCCCGAMQAQRNGTPMLTSSGYMAHVDAKLCAACGLCVDGCQFDAIAVHGDRARIDGQACMGCGVCVSRCPEGAIELVREPAKGLPLEILELMDSVAT
jgi:ferredoxin